MPYKHNPKSDHFHRMPICRNTHNTGKVFACEIEFSLPGNLRNSNFPFNIHLKQPILIENSDDSYLQDIDQSKLKNLDRKRRDTTDLEFEDDTLRNVTLSKRSNTDEVSFGGFDDSSASESETSELLEESENNDDVQRRTRQLRPSIISGPWRVSSGATLRAIDYPSGRQFPFSQSLTAAQQSGQYYKGDGRFFPSQSSSTKNSNEFQPIHNSYNTKNNYNSDYKPSNYATYEEQSGEKQREVTPKYKQSSKIPSQSLAFLPILYTFNPFDNNKNRPVTSTTLRPTDDPDNYVYFNLGGKPGESSSREKSKTIAFPVKSQPSTTRSPFISYNSVGGFFNNQSPPGPASPGKFAIYPVKTTIKSNTPAPIYENERTPSSISVRYNPSTPKYISSTPFPDNGFINNLKFTQKSPPSSVYSFNSPGHNSQENGFPKVVEITTKSPVVQYSIPVQSSTPKYSTYVTATPSGILDFDRFIASIKQSSNKSPAFNWGFGNSVPKSNKTILNNSQPYGYYPSSSTTSTTLRTTTEDEYYYDESDEDIDTKTKVLVPVNSSAFGRKPVPVAVQQANTNSASEEDEYYDDDEEDDDEQYKPPLVFKNIYAPLTETMAPRPYNMTTPRPNYVSGQTFPTRPPTTTSSIPPIISFPDEDVFKPIRPNSQANTAPAIVYINKSTVKPYIQKSKPTANSIPSNENVTRKTTKVTKQTTVSTTPRPQTTTPRKLKPIKVYKPTTKLHTTLKTTTIITTVSTSTQKPNRIRNSTKRKVYTVRPNRGQAKFKNKTTTSRPDLTNKHRLELDEKLPNR